MDFLKDCIKLHHQSLIDKLSNDLFVTEYDKENFKLKYNKKNYCMIKIGNQRIINDRVQVEELIYNLICDHNPSLNR